MLSLERMPDVIGYLVLTEDGAVMASGGEMENDERSANIINGLIQMCDTCVYIIAIHKFPINYYIIALRVDSQHFASNSCQRICIAYEEHSYVICMSNKKVYVVKKKHPASSSGHSSLVGATVEPVDSSNVLA